MKLLSNKKLKKIKILRKVRSYDQPFFYTVSILFSGTIGVNKDRNFSVIASLQNNIKI